MAVKKLWICDHCKEPILSNEQSRVFSTKKAVLHFHYDHKRGIDCYKEYVIERVAVRGRE